MSLFRRFSFCASLVLIVPAAAHADSLAVSPARPVGCLSTTATVTLSAPAPPGGAVFAAESNNAAVTVPGSVTVAQGASTATFAVQTSQVPVDTFVTITLVGPSPAVTRVSRSFTITPNAPTAITATTRVGGNSSGSGTVTMTCAAPPGGLTVNLTSSNTGALTVPATATVAEGATTGAFTFTTGNPATSTAVSVAAIRGGVQRLTTVTVKPPTVQRFGFTFSVPVGGDPTTGEVTLDFPAGAGTTVTVTSANPSVAAPTAATFTVAPGSLTGTFNVTTTAVLQDTPVVFTASLNGASKTATLTVRKNRIERITLSQKVVSACRPVDAVVALKSPAPAGGFTVNLATNRADLVQLSTASVTIPQGFQEAAFTLTPASVLVGSVPATVTATLVGQSPAVPLTIDVDTVRTSLVGCE